MSIDRAAPRVGSATALLMLLSSLSQAATLQVAVPGPYAENGGAGTFDVVLTREPGDVGDCTVSGEVVTVDGTAGNVAIDGSDFAGVVQAFGMTMAAAQGSATQTFSVNILDDALYEGPSEHFGFSFTVVDATLCSAIPAVTPIPGTDIATIVENETPQLSVGFSVASLSVDESVGGATFQVDFAEGNLAPNTYTVSVDVASAPDSATSPADFTAYSSTLDFGSPASLTDTVAVIDDAAPEPLERFLLNATATLIDREGTAFAITANPDQLQINIVDNDGFAPGFIDFAQPTFAVDEGAGTVTVTVNRTGGTDGVASATFTTEVNSGTTADADVDFTTTSGTLNWAAGDATPQSFTVPIVDDPDLEPTETFEVVITGTTGAALGNASRATVEINDNDDFVDPGPDAAVDGAQGGTVNVTFAVTGAAPFTLATNLGAVTPTNLPAAGNATFSFDIPVGTAIGTTFVATITVTNAAGTAVTKDITITVTAARALGDIAGLTPNQRSLATYLDTMCPRLAQQQVLSDEQGQLLAACSRLLDLRTTDTQVRGALDAINPEELIVAATTALRLTSMQNGNLMQRINALRSGASGIDLAGLNVQFGDRAIAGNVIDHIFESALGATDGGESIADFGRWGLFVNGNVKFGDKDATANEAAFDYDSIGITAGIDYRLEDNLVLGFALGYATVDSDFTASSGKLDIESWSASLFGTYFDSDRFYLDSMLTIGKNDYDTRREISYVDFLGPVQETASGDTDGLQWSAGISAGYDFNVDAWTIGPHAGAYYFDVDADQFTESGAGGYNLVIGDQHAESFQLNAGGHVSVVVNRDWGVLIPHLRVDWVHELEDSAEQVNVQLANDPFALDPNDPTPLVTLETDRPDADYFVMSVGASAQFVNGVSGFVNYRTMAGFDDFSMNEFTWGLRFERTF